MSEAIVKDLRRLDQRIAHTEVKEVPLTGIGARVYNDANISINNTTLTALTFNQERIDTDGLHSTSANTSRLTCTRAGQYHSIGHAAFAANATGLRALFLRLNGTTIIAGMTIPSVGAGDNTSLSIATVYTLIAGDYIELLAYQSSGGALDVLVAANYSPELEMWKLP